MIDNAGSGSSVQVLCITLWRHVIGSGEGWPYVGVHVSPWAFEFSGFDRLVAYTQLKELQFSVNYIEVPTDRPNRQWPSQPAYAHIQDRTWAYMKLELSRIGRLIVQNGNEKYGAHEEDFRIHGNHVHKYLKANVWNLITVWKYIIRK
jgi:hypothetical protein